MQYRKCLPEMLLAYEDCWHGHTHATFSWLHYQIIPMLSSIKYLGRTLYTQCEHDIVTSHTHTPNLITAKLSCKTREPNTNSTSTFISKQLPTLCCPNPPVLGGKFFSSYAPPNPNQWTKLRVTWTGTYWWVRGHHREAGTPDTINLGCKQPLSLLDKTHH